MDQRKKEEKLVKDLKNPDNEHSSEISKLINKTIESGNTVWLGTDWHLWLREEKNKPECHRRSDAEQIIKNFCEKVKQNDLLIYLGDLVDGEFQDKEQLKMTCNRLAKNMILVKGNNDLFDKNFYKSCGFKYVVESFVWKNMLFTHIPVVNNNDINIHGHIHGYKTYWIPYSNQIDVAYLGGRKEPVKLQNCIKAQPKYSTLIKECPEHFNEHSITIDVFSRVMNKDNRVYDPYIDDGA